jgi:hypothetical protein
MRRLGAAVVCAVVLTLLGACGRPAGVDGLLTDDWKAAGEPATWSPKAGDCHKFITSEIVYLESYHPVTCDTTEHTTETVHVGTFAGEHANRVDPPPYGSPGHRAAFAECVEKTKEYLGDDFRTGRVWLLVGLPANGAWSGGARWFRCDIWEYADEEDKSNASNRTKSLRGALGGDRPLGFGCYVITDTNTKDNEIDKFEPVACDKPHNGEYAGLFVAKDVAWPKDDKRDWEVNGQGCYGVVAKYAGLKDDRQLPFRVSFVYTSTSEKEWQRGNRGVRCTLWLDKSVTKLMKGAGPRAFPVH